MAALSCLHGQHVRHQPPFRERAWVLTAEGRAEHLGTAIDCPLCDRAELPDGLVLARTVGPFDESTLPAGLQRDHRLAEHTWGMVRVLDGSLELVLETTPPLRRALRAGDEQAIPPTVVHAVTVGGPVRLEVDFLVAPG